MSGAIPNIFTNGWQMNKIRTLPAFLGVLLLPLMTVLAQSSESPFQTLHGAIVRGDTSRAELALVFTGDAFAEGGAHIAEVLIMQEIKASFFFTGKFYRNPEFESLIGALVRDGHYLGAHSDQHLLYCDWIQRDSLLVTEREFREDLMDNYQAMSHFGIRKEETSLFLPPYEWYNDSIARWTRAMGFQLVNNSSGTLSHADYTLPGSSGYRSSKEIYRSIMDYESTASNGLNGFILLVHIGTAPERKDKFYFHLEKLLEELKSRGYRFERIDELLSTEIQ